MNLYFLIPVYSLVCLVIVMMTKYKYRIYILPNTVYTVLWAGVGCLGILNNLDLLEPSLKVHFYILTSIVIFNITYFIFSPQFKSNRKPLQNTVGSNYIIDYKLVYYFTAIALLLLSIHTVEAFNIVLRNGLDMTLIRNTNNYNVENSGVLFFGFLTRSIPLAITTAVSLISAINLNLNNKKLSLCAILLISVYTFTFGGRFQLLNFVTFYLATYLIFKNKFKVKIRKRYIGLAIIMLALMTILRGAELSLLIEKVIIYFVGSLSFLELIISNPNFFGIGEVPIIGFLTFGFIFEPIVLALKLFFGVNIDVPSYYFNIHAQKFYDIGEATVRLYNNNTTMFYNFIYDFGQIGVILGPIIICLLICISESKYNKKNNLRSLLFLVFLYSVIVNSPMMYTLTNINSSLILIFLFIFVKKQRKSTFIKHDRKVEGIAW